VAHRGKSSLGRGFAHPEKTDSLGNTKKEERETDTVWKTHKANMELALRRGEKKYKQKDVDTSKTNRIDSLKKK